MTPLHLLASLVCLTLLTLVGAVLLKLCIRWVAKEEVSYKSLLTAFLFTACALIMLATLINITMQGVNKLLRSKDLYLIVEVTKNVLKPIVFVAGLTFFGADKAHIPVSRSFLSVALFVPLFIPSFVAIVFITSLVFRMHPFQLMPTFMQ